MRVETSEAPINTIERTKKLIHQAQNGDAEAKEMLVTENSGLIWSIVRRFSGRGCEPEDLFQIGSIGLLKCIDKFDLGYDVRFSTYAVPMILGEIRRFLRDDGLIKVSRPLKEMAIKAKYVQEALIKETGCQPTVEKIAELLGTSAEELVMALESAREVESLYSTVNGAGNDKQVYLLDRFAKNSEENVGITDKIVLQEMIGELNERERQIIVMRYFRDRTQSDVAKLIGVSQVQVSRIEKRILKGFREKMLVT